MITLNRKAATIAILAAVVFLIAVITLAPTYEATGRTEVRQESVCTHSYTAGAKGGTHQQCDQYVTVPRVYCEYTYTSPFGTYTAFGGCRPAL